jgi:hypothetical protein
MQAWLASNYIFILGIIAALASGWVGLNRRQKRQLSECLKRCARQSKTIIQLRREYKLTLEFNFQDRSTIRKLALLVREYEEKLKMPPRDILLALYDEADRELKARRRPTQQDPIHLTFPAEDNEDYPFHDEDES